MDHAEKLSNWLKEGCWITCEVIENQLKVSKMPTTNGKAHTHFPEGAIPPEKKCFNSDSLNSFVEDHISGPSEKVDIPNVKEAYVLDKEFCKLTENDSPFSDEPLFITVNDNYTKFQAKDNGKAIAFFIIHILSSTSDDRYYKFRDITYKRVIIFGIITEVVSSKRKTITIDDGTGQLKCYLEDGLNERNKYLVNNDQISLDGSFGDTNQMLTSKLKELSSSLPTFESLHIGDRVCISGNISFHSGYFNLFVEKLERHVEITAHIKFMKRVFYLYENSYY